METQTDTTKSLFDRRPTHSPCEADPAQTCRHRTPPATLADGIRRTRSTSRPRLPPTVLTHQLIGSRYLGAMNPRRPPTIGHSFMASTRNPVLRPPHRTDSRGGASPPRNLEAIAPHTHTTDQSGPQHPHHRAHDEDCGEIRDGETQHEKTSGKASTRVSDGDHSRVQGSSGSRNSGFSSSSMLTSLKVSTRTCLTNRAGRYMSHTQASLMRSSK